MASSEMNNVHDVEDDDIEKRRGKKRPVDDLYSDNFATLQMCIKCKQESDSFVPVACSHVFCSYCYKQLFSELQPDSEARCPEDGLIITPSFDAFSNLSAGEQAVVPKMKMQCTNKERGCEKMVFFQDMNGHLKSCVHRLLPNCPYGCQDQVVFKDLTAHLTNYCGCRLVKCDFCHDDVPLNTKQDHEDKCPNKPVSCPYCNTENILLKELKSHIENCDMSPSICVMRQMGCPYEGTKKTTEEHLKNWPNHVEVLVKCITSMQHQLNELVSRVDALNPNTFVPNSQGESQVTPQKKHRQDSALCEDGIFLWQINTKGKSLLPVQQFCSPKFYIYKQGYHMCLKLVIGDEISLRIYILEGENDATLPWPFAKKMKVTIQDAYDNFHHQVEIDPTIPPPNFRVSDPKNTRNKWVGVINKFIDSESLATKDSCFVRNNTINIKFQVF